jgi:glycosyltransferase involved in cell wall biosynthesis
MAVEWLLDTLISSVLTRYACGSLENLDRLIQLRGFAPDKAILLPNTPHPSKFHVAPQHIERPDCALFLAVGHLQKHKGHGVLIEAARLLRDELRDDPRHPTFHVWIEGFGECRAEYQVAIADANLAGHVTLLGRVSGVQNYMRACDVFVHPSYGPDDLPNVVSEALQLGKPIIGTNHVGIPSQVTPTTGILVEPNNAPQLARAMRTLLDDAPLSYRLGEGARLHFESAFSYHAVVPQYLRLYEELLGNPTLATPAKVKAAL